MSYNETEIENARAVVAAADKERIERIIALLPEYSNDRLEDMLDDEEDYSVLGEAILAEQRRRSKIAHEAASLFPGALPHTAKSFYNDSVRALRVGDFLQMQSHPGMDSAIFVEVTAIDVLGNGYRVWTRKTNTDEVPTSYHYDIHDYLDIRCPHVMTTGSHWSDR